MLTAYSMATAAQIMEGQHHEQFVCSGPVWPGLEGARRGKDASQFWTCLCFMKRENDQQG